MKAFGLWVIGVVVSLIGLAGLFLAAHAHDGMIYTVGLLLFLFAVVFIFAMITRLTDYHKGHDPAID